ncbi:MAG: hypothetical protein M1825_002450 [Sarcosagium campestre]|nr:MAG: hypothetical protein M1825_002450 [Sarcosagium campestre]
MPIPTTIANKTDTKQKWVTLVSEDGWEFVIERRAACVSQLLRRMLDTRSNFAEAISGRCVLETIRYRFLKTIQMGAEVDDEYSGVCLQKVCEYLYYNLRNADRSQVPDMDIPPEMCLELLIAADFLDI